MSAGFVISFSGRIASGKTSVTKALADALGWPRVGFSDFLRSVLAARGIAEPDRQALQDLGQSLVAADPEKFCRDVMAQAAFKPGGNLVVDGIRHVEIHRRVAAIVQPSRTRLIHLAADDDVAAQRVRQRGTPATEYHRANQHLVEAELRDTLPGIANSIIDASQPLSTVVLLCLLDLEHFGLDKSVAAQARARADQLLQGP